MLGTAENDIVKEKRHWFKKKQLAKNISVTENRKEDCLLNKCVDNWQSATTLANKVHVKVNWEPQQ